MLRIRATAADQPVDVDEVAPLSGDGYPCADGGGCAADFGGDQLGDSGVGEGVGGSGDTEDGDQCAVGGSDGGGDGAMP